jgi:hypothetical protein
VKNVVDQAFIDQMLGRTPDQTAGGVLGGRKVTVKFDPRDPAVLQGVSILRSLGYDAQADAVNQMVSDAKKKRQQREHRLKEIVRLACHHASVDVENMLESTRNNSAVAARHTVWFLAYHALGMTYSSIGRYFKRDVACVINGIETMRQIATRQQVGGWTNWHREKKMVLIGVLRDLDMNIEDLWLCPEN